MPTRCDRVVVLAALLLLPALLLAQDYPATRISNGVVTAELYLPDALHGSYRATRFDWSGIVRSLTFQGHGYFGQWYDTHDPLANDAITGPVNVFDSPGPPTSYAEAKTGGTFLRIGVGHLEKPEEPAYRESSLYKIVDPGTWHVDRKPDSVRFTHELPARNGYGYVYVKTVALSHGKAVMVLSQELKNTGSKPLDVPVYNHGFFQIDQEPAGPGLVWSFPFPPRTKQDFGGMAEIRDRRIAYVRELQPGERSMAQIEGFGESARDYHFVLENLKTGAGVRVSGDHPIEKMTFWSRRMGYSPEVTIRLRIPPGESRRWETRYEFYVASNGKKGS